LPRAIRRIAPTLGIEKGWVDIAGFDESNPYGSCPIFRAGLLAPEGGNAAFISGIALSSTSNLELRTKGRFTDAAPTSGIAQGDPPDRPYTRNQV